MSTPGCVESIGLSGPLPYPAQPGLRSVHLLRVHVGVRGVRGLHLPAHLRPGRGFQSLSVGHVDHSCRVHIHVLSAGGWVHGWQPVYWYVVCVCLVFELLNDLVVSNLALAQVWSAQPHLSVCVFDFVCPSVCLSVCLSVRLSL